MATMNAIDNLVIPLPLKFGGSGDTSFATSTGIIKYDGTKLVTSSTAKIDASNRMTNTGQPAFSAYYNDTLANVTGDGTAYNIVLNTEQFDQDNNFASGTTFTAPVTGKYMFFYSLVVGGVSTSFTDNTCYLETTAATYLSVKWNNATDVTTGGNQIINNSHLVDMTAGDTANFYIKYSGGTKIIDVLWPGAIYPSGGYLIC
jgi:GTP-sensing pleiotropic transcriptional regulator CodY